MAKYAGVTTWQVRADLGGRRSETATDPQFAEKVIDVVGLYMDPPDNAIVLSTGR